MPLDLLTVNNANDYTPPAEGTHVARCLRIVDLGTQDTEFQGKKMERPQVILQFIVLDDENLAAPIVTRRYTASLHPKSGLRQDLENWIGKVDIDFTMKMLLNRPCLVTVTHREKDKRIYANVSAVSGVPKGMDVPEMPPE
jgi:hypothetical protein